jgi:sucrose-6-phosphate hydrolase SacC (GH32 family)
LSLHGHELRMEPLPELAIIHGPKAEFANLPLSEAERHLGVEGLALDIAAEIEAAGTVGLVVACAPDGSEQTRIIYDPDAKRLIVQREQSSLGADHESFANEAPHELAPGEILKLRILLDSSVLEIIANSRTSVSSRIYPSRTDSRELRIFGQGLVKSMTIWHMQSIWPES